MKVIVCTTIAGTNITENTMWDLIEIRKVENGYVVAITDNDGVILEYVYDGSRKALKAVKDLLDSKEKS